MSFGVRANIIVSCAGTTHAEHAARSMSDLLAASKLETAAVAEAGSRLLRHVLEKILDLCGFFDLINLAPSSRAQPHRRHGSRPSFLGSRQIRAVIDRRCRVRWFLDRIENAGKVSA